MSTVRQLISAVITAVVIGGALGLYDTWRGAQWEVSPQEIAQAQAQGKLGVERRPGTVTVQPILDEDADLLPYKWLAIGIAAGALVFVAARKRENA